MTEKEFNIHKNKILDKVFMIRDGKITNYMLFYTNIYIATSLVVGIVFRIWGNPTLFIIGYILSISSIVLHGISWVYRTCFSPNRLVFLINKRKNSIIPKLSRGIIFKDGPKHKYGRHEYNHIYLLDEIDTSYKHYKTKFIEYAKEKLILN